MRLRTALALVLGLLLACETLGACAAIVGVEDVRLRKKDAGDDADSDDGGSASSPRATGPSLATTPHTPLSSTGGGPGTAP